MKIKFILILYIILIGSINIFAAETVLIPEMINKAKEIQDELIIKDQTRLKTDERQRMLNRVKAEKATFQDFISIIPQKEAELVSFNITEIALNGTTKLDAQTQQFLITSYLNKNLTTSMINELIANISNTYASEGYITVRVYVPEQNLKSGKLVLNIIEGKIEKIVSNTLSELQIYMAFPNLSSSILNMRNLEQGLDQINRLGMNKATVKLIPSTETVGSTTIYIENELNKPTRASIRYDILSEPTLQLLPNSLDLSYDNLIGINDQFAINYSQRFKDREQFQNSLTLSTSLPFGHFLYGFSYNAFNNMTLVQGEYRNFTTSGANQSLNQYLQFVAYRNNNSKGILSAELLLQDNKNYIEDTINEIGGNKASILTLGWQYNWYLPSALMVTSLKYIPNQKLYGDINYNFSNLTINLFGQYAFNSMENKYRINLGDYASVPGFSTQFQGDYGAYGSIRANYGLFFSSLHGGFAWKKDLYNAGERGYMTSLSSGINYSDSNWSLEFGFAKGLQASNIIPITNATNYFTITKTLL